MNKPQKPTTFNLNESKHSFLDSTFANIGRLKNEVTILIFLTLNKKYWNGVELNLSYNTIYIDADFAKMCLGENYTINKLSKGNAYYHLDKDDLEAIFDTVNSNNGNFIVYS